MNAFEKLTDLIAALVLLFGVPLLYYAGKTRMVQEMTAEKVCESFLQRCSLFGEIREEYLEALESGLAACGCTEYEICGEREIYFPEDGGYYLQYVKKNTDFFISKVREQGSVALMPGDCLSVTVSFFHVPTVYSVTIRSGKET